MRISDWSSDVCSADLWFELFDFIIYGYFAAQIGHAMFPEADPVTIILSSFATYGVGFVMRPVGGVVLGHFGDLYGRKSALVFTMLLMAGATGATGLIPSYATIGIRSEEHTSELQSLMRISYAVFCLKKK